MASKGLITANRLLSLTILACIVGSFAPTRFLEPADRVARVAERLAAPIGAVVGLVGRWLGPGDPAEAVDPTDARILDLERLVRLQDLRIEELLAEIESYERTARAGLDRVRLLRGRVFADSLDPRGSVISVRRGSADGVTLGSVAVSGQSLIGRVTALDPRFCRITPIGDRNAAPIEVIAYPEDAPETGVRFDLTPESGGMLRGPGRYVTSGPELEPALVPIGTEVFLSDPAMSPHWGLKVGRVVETSRDPDSPLRQVIAVQPDVDPKLVASVILRIPEDDPPQPAVVEPTR
ncbi:MAG: rod shape-determining protein MreC [Planctomycetota bacterium]